MDMPTGVGATKGILESLHVVFHMSQSEYQWMLATLFAAVGSTVVYNIIKFKTLDRDTPDKWSWTTLPFWFLIWLNKAFLLAGVVLILWYILRVHNRGG
jgi:hypothetical protein